MADCAPLGRAIPIRRAWTSSARRHRSADRDSRAAHGGQISVVVIAAIAVVAAMAVQALGQGTARADRTDRSDRVDRLVAQLRGDGSYKVRLAAAINLSKIGDPRAIPAFVEALRDKDTNLRGVAATALGELVTAGTPRQLEQRAIDALEDASRRDKSALVRKQAQKALAAIRSAGTDAGAGGVYVSIGPMASKVRGAKGIKELMRRTVEKTIAARGGSMRTSWPGGRDPTARQLESSGTDAYFVDGTLVSLEVQSKGAATLVSCKLSMLLATYPKKSMFGFLDGGARVQVGSSAREIEYAKQDCVAAVVEDLIAKKIIPTIRMRTNSQAGSRSTRTTTQTRAGRERQRRR